MSDTPDTPKPSPYLAGLLCRCPNCGKGHLFTGFLTLRPRCEGCGLDSGLAPAGGGPAVFLIMIAGFLVCGAALVVEMRYAPPLWVHAVLWLALVLLFTLRSLRSLQGLLIALE